MLLLDIYNGLKLLAFHIWVLFKLKPLNMGRVDHIEFVLRRASGAAIGACDSKSCSFGNEGSIPSFGTGGLYRTESTQRPPSEDVLISPCYHRFF
jgi:hypothetical protein